MFRKRRLKKLKNLVGAKILYTIKLNPYVPIPADVYYNAIVPQEGIITEISPSCRYLKINDKWYTLSLIDILEILEK